MGRNGLKDGKRIYRNKRVTGLRKSNISITYEDIGKQVCNIMRKEARKVSLSV